MASVPPPGVHAEHILPGGATDGEDDMDSTGGDDEMVSGGDECTEAIAAARARTPRQFPNVFRSPGIGPRWGLTLRLITWV